MATRYEINGAGASLAPYDQKWDREQIGTDFNQRPIWEPTWTITLSFDEASATLGRQWLEAASSGSTNVTVLDRYKAAFVDLSGVYMIEAQRPSMTAAHLTTFVIMIKGVP